MVKVVHAVSIMNRAGQETFIMNLYRNIDRRKIQFDFQCSIHEKGDYDKEILQLGGNIHYLSPNPIKIPYLKYMGDIWRQYRFFRTHQDYKILHIHTYHAFNAYLTIMGAKLAGVKKVILHSHNTQGMHVRLHYIFRRALKHMNIIRLACSEEAALWMYGKSEVSRGRVEIINNGITPEVYVFNQEKRDEVRKKLGIDGKLVFGHVGRFNKQKNHSFLIDIFREIAVREKSSVLLLIGVGDLMTEIKQKAEAYGLSDKIFFLNARGDIPDLLQAMDCFLFPSLYEGLSVVAVEAQAAGVPVLASNTMTDKTKITDCMEFLPLEADRAVWAETALKMAAVGHKITLQQIKRNGYDMREIADHMQKIYMK